MFNKLLKILTLSTLIVVLLTGRVASAEEVIYLTEEEKDYIKDAGVIKAVSLAGVAPLQYFNSKGEIQGISWRVLEEISAMTGLVFEYHLYNTVGEGINSDGDIYFSANTSYSPDGMKMSEVFLKSETILYMNSAIDVNRLEDTIYAAVKGGSLPEGIREENVVYYDTREDSLNAVDAGEAGYGYGYGNAYSVAFYTLQNNYNNIITIPKGKEIREYRIGLMKDDEMLLSIINKGIDAIDELQMQNLILDVTSHIERKITMQVILEAYGVRLFLGASLIIGILMASVIFNIRTKNKVLINSRRYELLSHISNEYFYEYNIIANEFKLSDKLSQQIDVVNHEKEVKDALKTRLQEKKDNEHHIIKLPLINGGTGVFKSISFVVYGNGGKAHSILGKLLDISQEYSEKEKLLAKTKKDGMTGLFNSTTTKELIIERINSRDEKEIDAFLLMDLDRFKNINDTLGHLVGDKVLQSFSSSLKSVFRATDIMGRVGGDEFCVYVNNIPSYEFINKKAHQLNERLQKNEINIPYTASIGILLVQKEISYEELFEGADKALYQAKDKGLGQVVFGKIAH